MQHTHDQGLVLGDITLSDIIVSPELWIRVRQCHLLTIIIHIPTYNSIIKHYCS